MDFEANPETVLQVLTERGHNLAQQGDRMLQLEIERAMWIAIAHQQRAEMNEEKTEEDARPADS